MKKLDVLTMGTFDVFHFGHVDFLKICQRFGHLTVGVNSDRFVVQYKGIAPILSQAERMYAISQLGVNVVLNDGPGRALLEAESPDVLVVGSDWARKDYYAQIDVDQDWLDAHHIALAYVPYVQYSPISTTEIKRRVRAQ